MVELLQVLLGAIERRLHLRHLGLAASDLRPANGQVALRGHLLVQAELVSLLAVVQNRGGDQSVGRQLAIALDGGFQKGEVRPLRVNLVALVGGLGGFHCGLGGLKVGAGFGHARSQLLLVKLHQHLAGLHVVAVIGQNLLHNAAGFGFDLHLDEGLDLARGHHRASQVPAGDVGQFRRVNRIIRTQCRGNAKTAAHHDDAGNRQQVPFLPLAMMIICHYLSPGCRDHSIPLAIHTCSTLEMFPQFPGTGRRLGLHRRGGGAYST